MNAIEVQNLGKMFRIGEAQLADTDLTTAFVNLLTGPFRRVRSLIANQLPDFAEKEFWALKDISFDVQEGEVMGIIGRNGAGKSTLLKILTGISAPTEGRALIRGRVGSLLEVGTGFHPELTGRENVFMNGTILGMKNAEIKAKFDEIVAFSGVEEFIDTPVKRYSSGMQVRLAFSVAAHLEPEVLLVDEVLSVGDVEFRRKSLGKMRDVTGKGRTVVIVSHNMASIQNLCNRAILLEGGRIAMLDNAERVIMEYLNRNHAGEATSTADLTAHPGRKRGSTPTLTRVRVLNGAGEPTPVIGVGDPLTLEVSLNTEDRSYANSYITLSINTEREQRMVKFSTEVQLNRGLTFLGEQRHTCTWPECILSPGEYNVDIALRTNSTANERGGSTVDQISQAITFEVAPADIHGTGRIPSDGSGLIWPRAVWDSVQVDNRKPEAL
ncbi:MAG: ABC transporter ATP-binding protein [Chloroflexi bacterium]|nr:ABC transporter ATP-binding protein [Chloroflexota bacterium]